jgi:hypothetical protein
MRMRRVPGAQGRALRSSLLLLAAGTLGLGMLEVAGSPPAGAASGASYVVNSAASGSGTSGACAAAEPGCTLAQAVADYDTDTSGSDTISFSPSLDGETITFEELDLDNANVALTITGNGPSETAISGGEGGDQAIAISSGTAEVTIESLTVEDCQTGYGAISNESNLTVADDTFSGNSAQITGGAINSGSNGGTGTLTVTASTFSGNTGTYGGAITSGSSIATVNEGTGTLTVSDSTFSGNSAVEGGAIASGLADDGTGTLTVTASTFSGNNADDGGAIDNGDSGGTGTLTVTASTFSGNNAADGGAIDSGDNRGHGTATVATDVFAGSSACDQNSSTWSDEGYNVGTDSSCFDGGTGDATSSSLASELGALADNGGPTETIEPLPGNPALGIIPFSTSGLCPVDQDQRGLRSPIVFKANCNAGAVQSSFLPTVDGDPAAEVDYGAEATFGVSALPAGAFGVVTFFSAGGTQLCAFSYPSATSCSDSITLAPGDYSGSAGIVASFAETHGTYPDQASDISLELQVEADPTTTTLRSSANPVPGEDPVTFTATVAASSGSETPAGDVAFEADGSTLPGCASVTLSAASPDTASCTARFLGHRHEAVTAVYAGGGVFSGSTSAPLAEKVGKGDTSVRLRASHNPVRLHKSVTFRATVLPAAGNVTPTGTVAFRIDGARLAGCKAVAVSATGAARCTTAFKTAGTETVTAVYSGSKTWTKSTSKKLVETVR